MIKKVTKQIIGEYRSLRYPEGRTTSLGRIEEYRFLGILLFKEIFYYPEYYGVDG